jgi:microcystin-dependent protein
MASTWSNLKIQLMGAGDESGTWGTVTNANLGTAIEEAIAGSSNVTFASADVTLTLTDTTASQTARNMRLNLTGTTGGSPRELVVPAIEKMYVVNNGCADTVTIKVSGQTGIAVPAGKTVIVFNNGTDCVNAITHLTSLTLGSALPATSGGTGINAAGTAGNVLTSTGSAWASTALPSTFISGMILLWSGSIASIPAGWVLCDGTNSTPDLRDRFIVGAGSTYAVNATGGSANAIVVSHTHTITDPGHSHTYLENTSNEYVGTGVLRTDVFNDQSRNTGTSTTGITVGSTGSSGTNANLPPYYALAYIMKT